MQKIIFFVVLIIIISLCSYAKADVTSSAILQIAPDFILPDQDGKSWKLSDVLKDYRAVVLAFYPMDNKRGWIREFVEFQQNIKKYESRKIKVIGISRDSAKSHKNFIAEHDLNNITLLIDEKGRIAKIYNADHWLLPLSKRVYLIIDSKMNIIYRKDTGLFPLLKNQSETLIGEIDRNIK